MFYAVTERFFAKNIFLRCWIQNDPISRLSGIFPPKNGRNERKKVNFKKISLSRRKQLSNAQFGQVESKKLKKLTDILFAASQKYINPEYESFRIKYDYFVNSIYKFGIN